MQESTARAY